MKKHIPNLITCCNLLCGCIGIHLAYSGDLLLAPFLMVLGGLFDFFDGFAARLLKVSSPIGKELDSLADMVSFGLLPGVILLMLLLRVLPEDSPLAYSAFIIPIFSALRLAKFNVDERQAESFIGVPTPANALLIGSFPLIIAYQPAIGQYLNQPYLLMGIGVVMSILLVSEIPLFALKFKSFAWKGNEVRYSFIAACIALLILGGYAGGALCILLYILLSIIIAFSFKKNEA